jgi:hypothetical protein
VNGRPERLRMNGVKNRVRGCERVAERIDISSKLSIYSLLDLHKLRWSVRGAPRHNMPILGRLLTTHASSIRSPPRPLRLRAISCMRVPSNVMKRGAAEVVCRLVPPRYPFQWVGVHATTPSETVSPYENTLRVMPPQKLGHRKLGFACSLLVRWSKIVRKDEKLEKLACASKG